MVTALVKNRLIELLHQEIGNSPKGVRPYQPLGIQLNEWEFNWFMNTIEQAYKVDLSSQVITPEHRLIDIAYIVNKMRLAA